MLFVDLQEEGRQLRLEREGKGKEKGNDKASGKHIEELKSKVKKARDTVKETKSRLAEAHGVVEATKQAHFACKGKGESQDKVKRETREETISRIEDVQGQWLR